MFHNLTPSEKLNIIPYATIIPANNYQYLGIGRLMINRTNSIQHLFVAKEVIKNSPPKEKNTKVIKLPQNKLFDLIMKDEFVQLSGQGLILKYLINNKKI